MRQAGIVAAGGLYALRHNVERLEDDQRRCRRLAEGLAAITGPRRSDLTKAQTNMVFAATRGTNMPAVELVQRLADRGVLTLDEGPWSVRFVTHLDLDDEDIEQTLAAVAQTVTAAV